MNKGLFVLSFLLTCFFVSTNAQVATNQQKMGVIYNYNVIFSPDLSNRLTEPAYKKPVTDNAIIDSILSSIFPHITNYSRKMNQMDRYTVDFINPAQIQLYNVNTDLLKIDLARFKNDQMKRITYIGPGTTSSKFATDKKAFSNEFRKVTNQVVRGKVFGADIWTYLNNLDSYRIDTTVYISKYLETSFKNIKKNILILFTDGYLESNNKFGSNKVNKALSQSMINAFRNDYNKNGKGRSITQFMQDSKYGITPISNPILKYSEIIVLELFDRSNTVAGNSKSPTDMEIIKAFWSDWFRKSGVTHFEFHEISPNASVARDKILRFMGIN